MVAKVLLFWLPLNRPDSLDKALLRPGRFDRRIPVELPDLAGREAILKVHCKKIMLEENVNLTPLLVLLVAPLVQNWPILSTKPLCVL